jgi:hypothetical protein
MRHPQLWWLLIAPRRDAQTFAVQKPRNEAIKQLILCPTIYVTPYLQEINFRPVFA